MRALNVGCGKDVKPAEEGWVNIDGFYEGPGVMKWDFTRFPWPFKDGEFDLVYCSHVMEHVPFLYEDHKGTKRDVIFTLFEEIHRVLKPGGELVIKAPWAGSDLSYCHPQHYRQIRPGWFGYFDPAIGENYYSDARFRLKEWERRPFGVRWPDALRVGRSKQGVMVHLWERLPFLRPLIRNGDELVMTAVALK